MAQTHLRGSHRGPDHYRLSNRSGTQEVSGQTLRPKWFNRGPVAPYVDTTSVERLGLEQGFTTLTKDLLARLSESLVALPVDQASTRSSHKQVINFSTLNDGGLVLSHDAKTRRRTIESLLGYRTVGFAGPVTGPGLTRGSRMGFPDMLVDSAREHLLRQLPALMKSGRPTLPSVTGKPVGVIRDDSTSASREFLGIVVEFRTSKSSTDTSVGIGSPHRSRHWIDPRGATLDLTEFEYWSQLALEGFYGTSRRGSTRYRELHPFRKDVPVVCVVGQIGSGKTTIAKELSKLGFVTVNAGEVMAAVLGMPPVPHSDRANLQQQAHRFITESDGGDALAKRIAWAVSSHDRSAVDGIRPRSTLQALRRDIGEEMTCGLYVSTNPHESYAFAQRREGGGLSAAAFFQQREAPIEQEVCELIEEANLVVYNWGGMDGLTNSVRDLFA